VIEALNTPSSILMVVSGVRRYGFAIWGGVCDGKGNIEERMRFRAFLLKN
jgi:hypothetical protein